MKFKLSQIIIKRDEYQLLFLSKHQDDSNYLKNILQSVPLRETLSSC